MKPISSAGVENALVDINNESPATPSVDGAESFSESLKSAISAVDTQQVEGDAQAQKLARGEGNLHETMLALEKADVTMRLAMKVRNKIVDTYNDIMRMTV